MENSREGQFAIEELMQNGGFTRDDIEYQVRLDKDTFSLSQDRIADFQVGGTDIWEVKGSYTSGVEMESQAQDYAQLMKAGYQVHYFFYQKPSAPYIEFLDRLGINYFVYGL